MNPSDRQRPICATLNPFVQVLDVFLYLHVAVLPRDFIYPVGGMALERQKRLQKQIFINVVQQRCDVFNAHTSWLRKRQ